MSGCSKPQPASAWHPTPPLQTQRGECLGGGSGRAPQEFDTCIYTWKETSTEPGTLAALPLPEGEVAPPSQIPAGRGACRGRAGVQVWEGEEEIFIFEPPSLLLKNKEKKNKLRVFCLSLWGPPTSREVGKAQPRFPIMKPEGEGWGMRKADLPPMVSACGNSRCGALTCDPGPSVSAWTPS